MEISRHESSAVVRIAQILNKRVIKTSYTKAIIYFVIALAVVFLSWVIFKSLAPSTVL